ncbi:MAG: hypothetical protein E2O39_00265 [Planctomycetota bacterium]|nr:MAG: hypothetical protein E2O39_00265 [Planctomycetota bacterium]
MAKHNQRLDYARLAEVLHEREIADAGSIRELLHHSKTGGTPFAVALVTSNLVGDWDLSRIVCETFNLPFLPVEIAPPDPEAAEGLDLGFLRENDLVPIGRFGQTLTVCMPGLVPADILGMLAAETDLVILPVVGTVQSNQRWMRANYAEEGTERALPVDASWSAMFDDADAAVLMDLSDVVSAEESAGEGIEFQLTDPEDDSSGLVDFTDDSDGSGATSSKSAGGGVDLPPLPEFG